MVLVCTALFLIAGKRVSSSTSADAAQVPLELPFSLWVALKYGLLFLVLQVAGLLAERALGQFGFYVVSGLGGLVSSASAVAAAAGVAAKGTISPTVAGAGAVIASLTSVLVNMPLVWRAKNPPLMRRLALAMTLVTMAGVAGAFLRDIRQVHVRQDVRRRRSQFGEHRAYVRMVILRREAANFAPVVTGESGVDRRAV